MGEVERYRQRRDARMKARRDAGWNEEDHPRGENGQFTSSGGSSSSEKTVSKETFSANKFGSKKNSGSDNWITLSSGNKIKASDLEKFLNKGKKEAKSGEKNSKGNTERPREISGKFVHGKGEKVGRNVSNGEIEKAKKGGKTFTYNPKGNSSKNSKKNPWEELDFPSYEGKKFLHKEDFKLIRKH